MGQCVPFVALEVPIERDSETAEPNTHDREDTSCTPGQQEHTTTSHAMLRLKLTSASAFCGIH